MNKVVLELHSALRHSVFASKADVAATVDTIKRLLSAFSGVFADEKVDASVMINPAR